MLHSLTPLVALVLPALLFVPLAFAQSPLAQRAPQHDRLELAEELEDERASRARRQQGGPRGAAMFAAPERRTLDFAASSLWAPNVTVPASTFAGPQEPMAAGRPQQPAPYVHVSSTDVDDPNAFWYTHRDTIVGERAADAWDPLKLINTDRPDFTDVATVVGNGVVQVETGFLRQRRNDGEQRTVVDTVPNVLVRVGHGDHFEWRLKWRGQIHENVTDLATGARDTVTGGADPEIGFKWVLSEQHDLLPMNTLVVRATVPLGSNDTSANRIEPGISYIYNWQIRRWWFLRGATGIDAFNQPSYSVLTSGTPTITTNEVERDHWLELSQAVSSYTQVSKRVGVFVEWFLWKRFGSNDDTVDNYHNYGLYLYATPDVQFDARVGWRFGDHADQNFYGFGFSTRF